MNPSAGEPHSAPLFPAQLQFLLMALAGLAICGSALLALNISPSSTFFNQAISLAGWALFLALLLLLAMRGMPGAGSLTLRQSAPAAAALLLMALAIGLSFLLERLPSALALSGLGLIAAAALTLIVAAFTSRQPVGRAAFQAVCVALLAAGLLSLLAALVQTFAPAWADGNWVAHPAAQGRAGGNLRQPNHLSSLLLWSIAALIWLHDTCIEKPLPARLNLWRGITSVGLVALTFGVVLTVSRTGTVCFVLLAMWGVLDRNLSRYSRALLWLAPLVYVLCWMGMAEWAQMGGQGFGGDTQLHKSDLSSSRFGIWANTLSLIAQNPWLGVGWGEFNFAWSLTPFPGRPVAFFDHTHNLPLNFLVEMGLPLGALVLALLAWALWKAFMACRFTPQPGSVMVRTAFVMVLMMAVHSMLEYPLWYAYFLLPTAFALGVCLGHSKVPQESDAGPAPGSQRFRPVLIGAALVLLAGTVFSVFDYLRVSKIFMVDDDDATSLAYRIEQGQKSIFFAHHADYADATVATHPSAAWKAFRRAPHLLLDTRLMTAWAKAYAEKGDVERARYIADRLREFRNPDSAEFFAECDKSFAPGEPKPFQCTPATRQFTYQDFKLR